MPASVQADLDADAAGHQVVHEGSASEGVENAEEGGSYEDNEDLPGEGLAAATISETPEAVANAAAQVPSAAPASSSDEDDDDEDDDDDDDDVDVDLGIDDDDDDDDEEEEDDDDDDDDDVGDIAEIADARRAREFKGKKTKKHTNTRKHARKSARRH